MEGEVSDPSTTTQRQHSRALALLVLPRLVCVTLHVALARSIFLELIENVGSQVPAQPCCLGIYRLTWSPGDPCAYHLIFTYQGPLTEGIRMEKGPKTGSLPNCSPQDGIRKIGILKNFLK